jgi:hypothetical protein
MKVITPLKIQIKKLGNLFSARKIHNQGHLETQIKHIVDEALRKQRLAFDKALDIDSHNISKTINSKIKKSLKNMPSVWDVDPETEATVVHKSLPEELNKAAQGDSGETE